MDCQSDFTVITPKKMTQKKDTSHGRIEAENNWIPYSLLTTRFVRKKKSKQHGRRIFKSDFEIIFWREFSADLLLLPSALDMFKKNFFNFTQIWGVYFFPFSIWK